MGTIPHRGSAGGPAGRGVTLEPLEPRRRFRIMGRPDAVFGKKLEFARGLLVQSGIGDLPANAGMREQTFRHGRGMRHAGFMRATARWRIEKYQFDWKSV